MVGSSTVQKQKILLLSDDLRMHSGIATVSREFVVGTSHKYDWVQLGAALHHPDHGKIFDISADVKKHTNNDDVSVKIYAHTGYGNPDVLRELIKVEKPVAILHFTDPRFWGWLYGMEYEIHQDYGIPIMYLNIWDCPPAPYWNKPSYESCDLIMNISRQTHALVKMVLGKGNYTDIDLTKPDSNRLLSYIPHGINSEQFYPIEAGDKNYENFIKLSNQFKEAHDAEFIIFWNNRNIRRKMMGDIILAYKVFCDKLPKEQAMKCVLFMHTQMVDDNGTDLPEVVRAICPDYKIVFNEERLPPEILNIFYNMSDIGISIGSNEGFGLSSAETVMAGTPVIVNVTGGLQDQVRFEDENGKLITIDENFVSNHAGTYKKHGAWAKVCFPSNRSLQGSPMTPYIFDDRADFNDVADKIMEWYNTPNRKELGRLGREWFLSDEARLTSKHMCDKMIVAMEACINNWEKPNAYDIFKIEDREKITENGVIYK